MRSNSFLLFLLAAAAPIALFSPGCITAPPSPADAPAPMSAAGPLHTLDYAGNQQAVESLDRDIAAAGTDAGKLAALESRLVGALRRADATPAARQAVCQRLGALLAVAPARPVDAATLAAITPMLASDREVDFARLALEPVPGAAIDSAFVAALANATGRTRVALVQSIGNRRIAAAVPALGGLLNQVDAATAAAAATALGQVGDSAALTALRAAPNATAAAVVEAKLATARRLSATDAAALYRELQTDSRLLDHQRATALRGLIDVEPASATGRIAEALAGADWAQKQAAIEAIFTHPAPGLVGSLAAKLPEWDIPTQTAVLTAFGRRRETVAIPALVAATKHTEATVRAAAITALGHVPGNRELVALLGGLAAADDTDDAKLARQSLARLDGPGVSDAVLAGAGSAAAGFRVVFFEQLGLRNMTEGIPLLVQGRLDPFTAVRAAAVGALGEIAPASEQRTVLDWAVGATDSNEQSRALRALVNVTLRNPNTADRARPVFAAIEQAPPAVCVRLLPALSRFEDAASAECAARLALRNDAAVADAAAATLARWTDRTALVPLASVAEKSPVASTRATAVQGALRYLERNREPWSAELTTVFAKLFAATRDNDVRQRLALVLHRGNDAAALALAKSLQADAALADVARDAAQAISANLAGPPAMRASGGSRQLRNVFDGNTGSRWSVPTNGAEWLEIDFKLPRPVHRLSLDQAGRTEEFPEHYEVFVTDNPKEPGGVRASGAGQRNKTVIALPDGTRGRYVIIRNTAARDDSAWTISELLVD
ncbi:MAG: HEAT repeat domain-containing protein [Verrucomicrobia bacterium]|nr:HEAT repeat domain-containing protein [Verrucomicrobiota bacterium]